MPWSLGYVAQAVHSICKRRGESRYKSHFTSQHRGEGGQRPGLRRPSAADDRVSWTGETCTHRRSLFPLQAQLLTKYSNVSCQLPWEERMTPKHCPVSEDQKPLWPANPTSPFLVPSLNPSLPSLSLMMCEAGRHLGTLSCTNKLIHTYIPTIFLRNKIIQAFRESVLSKHQSLHATQIPDHPQASLWRQQ